MTDQNDSGNGSGSDSELGDFDAREVPPAGNTPETEPDTVPELRQRSEHDREIRPGDPVRDLWGGGWLVAVKKAADTVREYDAAQPDTQKSLLEYEGSKCMGATEEDTVWQCFYVNANNTLAGGRSGPYGFPESRICRYAYEATDGYKNGRFQDHIQMQVLERLFSHTASHAQWEMLQELAAKAFGQEMADEAQELAEAAGDSSA